MDRCCIPETDRIESLIPIGVVIGLGCKPCTKFYIDKALEKGCSKDDLKKIASIVESLTSSECLRKAVGEQRVESAGEALSAVKEVLEAKCQKEVRRDE
jgi:alkylhydroperoxidase/carboxymuconolactone decarboxylase family protein YurZ